MLILLKWQDKIIYFVIRKETYENVTHQYLQSTQQNRLEGAAIMELDVV